MESVIATREEVKLFLTIVENCDSDDDLDFDVTDGDGYGSIIGDGYGDGDCWGCGSGSDNCEGFGYGYSSCTSYSTSEGRDRTSYNVFCYDIGNESIKELNGNIVDYIDKVPTIITQIHSNIARGYTIKNDLSLSPCFIAKAGNSFAHGKTLKTAVSDANAKEMKRLPLEERIAKFKEIFGKLDSEHTGKEFYDWHHTLTGSCRMGRDEFCKAHRIDLEKKYTVRFFLDITKNSYGSYVIKLLRKAYGIVE